MGIEAATSSTMSVTNTNPNPASSNVSSKTNSDTSFKDEMTKVSTTEEKSENKEVSDKSAKESKSETSKEKPSLSSAKTEEKKTAKSSSNNNQDTSLNAQITFNQYSVNDANMMLTNDIQQMMDSASLTSVNGSSWFIGSGDSKNSLQMNESDAQFFLNLTQGNEVSMNSIEAQGQGMINAGADASEIAQNVRVSQTLLTALQNSRQNNQPIRIDFDQNISVILRVGRDGALSAHFIPSDKVAEQYLRNNINELRSAFDEQELPYTELSYSHSSKEQNKKRREEQRQGE